MLHRRTIMRALVGMLLALIGLPTASAHPQDGPHIDYRITITDRGVGYSVGINLAFIDFIAPTSRESPEAVSGAEGDAVIAALLNHLRTNCPVSINGQIIEPVVESTILNANPDPGMVAIFPKTGMRGLIRANVVLHYPSPEPPRAVELTWDGYPDDLVSGELGPDGTPPPMTIEAQLQSNDKVRLVRFGATAPTVSWTAPDHEEDPFAALPPVPTGLASTPTTLPLITFGAAAVAGLCLVLSMATMSRGKTPVAAGLAAGVMIVAAGLTIDVRLPVPGTGSPSPGLTDDQKREVFEPLHANLYKAFDFVDESDVYDALEKSVDGPLLEGFYRQIFGSLIQAEQGGVLGIVTDVQRGEMVILPQTDGPDDERFGFSVRHVWDVEGTVYHWGHSHSRVNEYEAEFDIAATDAGWRIVGQRVLSQRRIDDPTQVAPSQLAPALPAPGEEI
ncbi:MAG: hypothetical protein ACI89L_000009 [Phycisphaerales bacterium]|jgi:hypothetical protein